MQYSENLRIRIVELISQGELSIPEICDKLHISYKEWKKWKKEYPDFREGIKIATWVKYENRLALAWRAQRKLLEGYDYEEVHEQVEIIEREDGGPLENLIKRKTVKKHIPPSTQAVIHALKALDPRLNPEQKIDHRSGGKALPAPSIFLNVPETAKSLKKLGSGNQPSN